MKARGVSNRQLAQAIQMNENYLSRTLSNGVGLSRNWSAIAKYFSMGIEWLSTGHWSGSSNELIQMLTGKAVKGGTVSYLPKDPATRGGRSWARLAERVAVPIRIGKGVFGFPAGTVLWTEERKPEMNDRIIVEKHDGTLESWIAFVSNQKSATVETDDYWVRSPDDVNPTQKSFRVLPKKHIKATYVVVGSRDRPTRTRSITEAISVGIAQAEVMGDEPE
jgi:hypothetical protein